MTHYDKTFNQEVEVCEPHSMEKKCFYPGCMNLGAPDFCGSCNSRKRRKWCAKHLSHRFITERHALNDGETIDWVEEEKVGMCFYCDHDPCNGSRLGCVQK